MTQKTEYIGVRLTPVELTVMQVIGESEQLHGWSEVIRFLIRKEAKQRKIWEAAIEQNKMEIEK